MKRLFEKKDRQCPVCGKMNGASARYCGKCRYPLPELSTDYEGRCGNCHKLLGGDAYCRYCGTKAGNGSYEPYEDIVQCVYGPMPVDREHVCRKCGYKWTSCKMIDDEWFCPICGGSVNVTEMPGHFSP
ncbi:MAG: zinc ribbon domain-containing protein [Ruminococcus sp.]|nr:zinc ribbon domain-containing protein [Ruminococcus sp.]